MAYRDLEVPPPVARGQCELARAEAVRLPVGSDVAEPALLQVAQDAEHEPVPFGAEAGERWIELHDVLAGRDGDAPPRPEEGTPPSRAVASCRGRGTRTTSRRTRTTPMQDPSRHR